MRSNSTDGRNPWLVVPTGVHEARKQAGTNHQLCSRRSDVCCSHACSGGSNTRIIQSVVQAATSNQHVRTASDERNADESRQASLQHYGHAACFAWAKSFIKVTKGFYSDLLKRSPGNTRPTRGSRGFDLLIKLPQSRHPPAGPLHLPLPRLR